MVVVLGISGRKHRRPVAPVHVLPEGLAVEPIVRVFTRTRRNSTLSAGLTAWFLGLLVVIGPCSFPPAVLAQEPEEASDDAPKVPAEKLNIDESKYDPPLTDAEQVKDWVTRQKGELRFTQAMRLEALGNADRETITNAVKHYLYRMTVKDERDNLHDIVQKVLKSVNSSRLATSIARNFANEEIVRVARELLNQPPAVRLNALILAASLVSDPSSDPPRPFPGATPLFVEVLEDPDQLVESKIWAVKGLARICRGGDIAVSVRDTAAVHFVDALDSPEATAPENWLYRFRLVDGLGDAGLAYNLQREPVVIDALVSVLSSRKEHWMIRSTAARSATRIPWDAADNINAPLITYLVCQLAREMAQARNANLKVPHWKYCFVNVYLSFQPHTPEERQQRLSLTGQVTRPHLAASQPLVESAYQSVLPVVNSVTGPANPRPTTAEEINPLDDWLKDNVPDDRKPTPSSREVDQSRQPAKPMAKSGSS